MALSTARAFLWVSSASLSGEESQTMPAPAWTAKVESSATSVRMAMARSTVPSTPMVPTAPP